MNNVTEKDLETILKLEKIVKKDIKKQYIAAIDVVEFMYNNIKNNWIVDKFKEMGKKWDDLTESQIKDLPRAYSDSVNNVNTIKKEYTEQIETLKKEIEKLTIEFKNCKKDYEIEIRELKEYKSLPSTASEDRIKYLESRDIILTKLENGGVDNWEWYEESLEADID